jgi:hypothetical protein
MSLFHVIRYSEQILTADQWFDVPKEIRDLFSKRMATRKYAPGVKIPSAKEIFKQACLDYEEPE